MAILRPTPQAGRLPLCPKSLWFIEKKCSLSWVCSAISGPSFKESTFNSETTMARKRKTAEERARDAEFRRRSDANLRKLRELVELGWIDLKAKRAAGFHLANPAWGPPPREKS